MNENAALRAQVEALQQKLHDLHATDVNTLRRSYATISQHVEALRVETSRLEALVHEVEPDIFTAEFLAEEFGKAAIVGGTGWVLWGVVKSLPPLTKARSWLGGGLFVATVFVISWRFASNSVGRFASAFFDHRRRKKAFLKEVAELQHRVDILQALTRTLPGAVSQPNLAALEAAPEPALGAATTGAAATGAAAAAAGLAASGSGNGGKEQFVVVDLPRVESGGFVLPSPVPSPPPPGAAAGATTQAAATPAAAASAASPGLPPVPRGVATGSEAVAAAGSSSAAAVADPQASTARVQPSLGPFAAVAGAAAAPHKADQGAGAAADSSGSTTAASAAAAEAGTGKSTEQQQQQQVGQAERPTSGPGYAIPDSVMRAGWGGVTQQQQPWRPPALPQQQQATGVQQLGAGVSAQQQQQQQPWMQQQQQGSPAVRQYSSGTLSGTLGEEGELIEQPSDPEDQTTGGQGRGRGTIQVAGAGAAAGVGAEQQQKGAVGPLQRGSPASSSSEDAVLLERE